MILIIFYITSVLLGLNDFIVFTESSPSSSGFPGCFPFGFLKSDKIVRIYNPFDTLNDNTSDDPDEEPCQAMDDRINDVPDDVACRLCENEKSTVSIAPCGHKIGSFCANQYEDDDGEIEGGYICPTCNGPIICYVRLDDIKNVPDDLTCIICSEEKSTVIIAPCGHKIGNICANKYQQFDGEERMEYACPTCNVRIKSYIGLVDLELGYQTLFPYRKLTQKELGRLMDSVANNMSDQEFMARFWYLQRDQEPDSKLLAAIKKKITKKDRYEIAEAKRLLLSEEMSEDELYKEKFMDRLSYSQELILSSYYKRHYKFTNIESFIDKEIGSRLSYFIT